MGVGSIQMLLQTRGRAGVAGSLVYIPVTSTSSKVEVYQKCVHGAVIEYTASVHGSFFKDWVVSLAFCLFIYFFFPATGEPSVLLMI